MDKHLTVPIAVCAAMRWEIRPVLRALRGVQLLRATQPRTWLARGLARPILVFQTGMGMKSAAEATHTILAEFSVGAIVNTGCAGALSPTLSAGATVCGSSLMQETPWEWTYPVSVALTSALRQAAEAAGLHPVTAPILTSPYALLSPETKLAAFDRCGAAAVEMEGTAVADVAAKAGVELGSVRVILDPATTPLPAPRVAGKTMFDFVTNTARSIVSVQEVKRFSVTAKNALIVDRVLGKLFTSFVTTNV
jgi:adenosylhomocysteine nucleosidase